jgi:thiol:disulfide interchange protein
MATGERATRVSKVAVLQNCVVAVVRHVARSGFIALVIGSPLVTAADLPRPLSDSLPVEDSSPVADSPLNRSPALQTNSKVLPVDSAFALQSFIEAGTSIVLRWEMPEGYYLYRKSLVVEKADGTSVSLELPAAETFTDEFFGEVAIYRDNLLIRLPFAAVDAKPGATIDLLLSYQGCAEALYCYPPEQKALTLNLPE